VEALLIRSDSDCPSQTAVQAEVRELTTPAQREGSLPDSRVVISDRGESIAVAITREGKTTVRVYQDAARDCDRRSHFVSVLAVVSLMPPDVAEAEPEPEPEPEPTPATPPPAAPEPAPPPVVVAPAPRRVRIELAARGEVSTPIADSARIASLGGSLGVALGARRLRPTLAFGYVPASELRLTGNFAGSAEVERLDVALGLRWLASRAPFDTGLELGLLASRAEVSGVSSHRPSQDTAFNLGARAGVQVCWPGEHALSPLLGAHLSWFPGAPELVRLPQGTLGHLPYVWLGLSGGLSLAL
jgi:hypothetical protein